MTVHAGQRNLLALAMALVVQLGVQARCMRDPTLLLCGIDTLMAEKSVSSSVAAMASSAFEQAYVCTASIMHFTNYIDHSVYFTSPHVELHI